MPAQNFKTAAELGISDGDLDALACVLDKMERGELVHTRPGVCIPNGFNMSDVLKEHECGTAACIAGWMKILSGDYLKEGGMSDEQSAAWGELIMPRGVATSRQDITPKQAATALRSYLTTGEANWREALASR